MCEKCLSCCVNDECKVFDEMYKKKRRRKMRERKRNVVKMGIEDTHTHTEGGSEIIGFKWSCLVELTNGVRESLTHTPFKDNQAPFKRMKR